MQVSRGDPSQGRAVAASDVGEVSRGPFLCVEHVCDCGRLGGGGDEEAREERGRAGKAMYFLTSREIP